MKRFLCSVLIATAFLATGRAYAQFGADTGALISNRESRAGIPVPARPQAAATAGGWRTLKAITKSAPKEWTVMVLLNAKNNLEMAGLYNVNDMEKVGSGKDLNIVVELGRMNGQTQGDTHADGDWTGARRYLLVKDADASVIKSPVLMSNPKVDMGDYKRAVDFVKWAKTNFPAKHYMFIIWNHGSGFMDPKSSQKGISFDDETGNYIRTPQIGQILKEAGKVDVMAFDACLMQMPEVAFEVKDNADVIVGSEETVPGLGYPYSLFLGAIARQPGMNAEQVGAVTVEAFKMFYDKMQKGAQLSAIRTSKLDGLATRLSDFAKAAQAIADTETLKAAMAGVIRYDAIGAESDPKMTISFYGDMAEFAQMVADKMKAGNPRAEELQARAGVLQQYIDKELVIDNKASMKNRVDRELSESRGMSVYLPPVEARVAQAKLEGIFESPYTDYAFDKATGWHDFVTFLYGSR